MSAKVGIFANYFSKIYIALIGIAMVPLYVHYMGAEGYGLVGFFVSFQSWLLLLDMGLSSTFSRELSRYRGGASSPQNVFEFLRSLEWLFGCLASLCIVSVYLSSNWIATHWLDFALLSHGEVVFCITAMGAMIGVRWLIGVYSNGLVGLDAQVAISVTGIVIATLRGIGSWGVLRYVSTSPVAFFSYQFAVFGFEALVTRWLLYKSLPVTKVASSVSWYLTLRPYFPFAVRMAYLSLVWGVITQLDKLLLSHWLSLESFGYFTAAITAAHGILLVSLPFAQAFQPKITTLAVQESYDEMIRLYRLGSEFATALFTSAAAVMVFFGKPLLLAWTNNIVLAEKMSTVLAIYACGNAAYALHNVAFQMQFAKGITRWQGIGSTAFALFWAPVLLVAAYYFEAEGVGAVWLIGNLLFLVFWVTFVHGKLVPAIRWRWLFQDVLLVALSVTIPCGLIERFAFHSHGRFWDALFIVLTGGVCFACGLLAGKNTRRWSCRQVKALMCWIARSFKSHSA